MNKMILIIVLIINLVSYIGCSKTQEKHQTSQVSRKTDLIQNNSDINEVLMISPNDSLKPILDAIAGAKEKIDMANYHLSNHEVINALIAAQKNNIKIRIILDNNTLIKSKSAQKIVEQLKSNNIEVKSSSAGFSITHEKMFVTDDSMAFVSTINLVTTIPTTRDFGIFTNDKEVISEINSVFAADWENADNNGTLTPELHVNRLVWSPINSLDKLKSLIGSAKKSIKLMVENLGEQEIHDALISKAKEGISIQVFTPGCVVGDGLHNRTFIKELQDNNIANRVSIASPDADHPYVHAKMIIVDNNSFFIGSENFSYNSLLKAREVGIITSDAQKAQKLSLVYDHDWDNGVLPESISQADCDKAKN